MKPYGVIVYKTTFFNRSDITFFLDLIVTFSSVKMANARAGTTPTTLGPNKVTKDQQCKCPGVGVILYSFNNRRRWKTWAFHAVNFDQNREGRMDGSGLLL